MKTFKKILAIVFVAATMTMVACSRDNDEKTPTPDTLSGSTWTGSVDENMMGLQIHIDMLLKFINATNGELQANITGGVEDPETKTAAFTYTYQAPNGTMTGVDEDGDTLSYSFTVDGNKMTLKDEGHDITLTRK